MKKKLLWILVGLLVGSAVAAATLVQAGGNDPGKQTVEQESEANEVEDADEPGDNDGPGEIEDSDKAGENEAGETEDADEPGDDDGAGDTEDDDGPGEDD